MLNLKRYFDKEDRLIGLLSFESQDDCILFDYLEELHSVADKFKKKDVKLTDYPEFLILRVLRNYFHHEGEIVDSKSFVSKGHLLYQHAGLLIVPLSVFAKALKSSKNSLKEKYYKKNLNLMVQFCQDISEINSRIDFYCNPQFVKVDNREVELGFDLYKSIYNISNVIAQLSVCSEKLKGQIEISEQMLDRSESVNIEEYDMAMTPSSPLVLTTNGFIPFPAK